MPTLPHTLRALSLPPLLTCFTLCGLTLCGLTLGCADEGPLEAEPPAFGEEVALRIENVSQFDYETLYAHMTPALNLSQARTVHRRVIPSKTFTEVSWPRGAYLTAVRRLVARGPRVAIRSEVRLAPEEGALLRLLDEGFVLVDSSEEPPL